MTVRCTAVLVALLIFIKMCGLSYLHLFDQYRHQREPEIYLDFNNNKKRNDHSSSAHDG